MTGELDRIDRKILKLLQEDGRLSNAELAGLVNVSPATCHRRTQRLFDEGFIQACALTSIRKRSTDLLVIVGVVLDRSTPQSFAEFEEVVRKADFVLDCHLVAGDFDYFLKSAHGTWRTSTSCTAKS